MVPEDIEWQARRECTPDELKLRDLQDGDFRPGVLADMNKVVAQNEAGAFHVGVEKLMDGMHADVIAFMRFSDNEL